MPPVTNTNIVLRADCAIVQPHCPYTHTRASATNDVAGINREVNIVHKIFWLLPWLAIMFMPPTAKAAGTRKETKENLIVVQVKVPCHCSKHHAYHLKVQQGQMTHEQKLLDEVLATDAPDSTQPFEESSASKQSNAPKSEGKSLGEWITEPLNFWEIAVGALFHILLIIIFKNFYRWILLSCKSLIRLFLQLKI
jgi:hypothetical protein